MFKTSPNMTKITQKMLKIDRELSQKCVSYCKIPTQDKKPGSCFQNLIADPQTYWAPTDRGAKSGESCHPR